MDSISDATDANDISIERNTDVPGLRYHDQTPVSKPTPKRPNIVLSPCDEENSEDDVTGKLKHTIEESMKLLIPSLVEQIKAQLMNAINVAVESAINNMKKEIISSSKMEIASQANVSYLRTLSEAEKLESYNRRDNLRILGIPECLEGENNRENFDTTIAKVVEISHDIGANVRASDISIAHRLPSRSNRGKPIIVRFARRIAKINLLRNKKKMADKEGLKNISVFEDLSKARVNFIKMMKSDCRIKSAWTRESVIHYVWKADERLYRIDGLYEGGSSLKYRFQDVINCFQSVFHEAGDKGGS